MALSTKQLLFGVSDGNSGLVLPTRRRPTRENVRMVDKGSVSYGGYLDAWRWGKVSLLH